MKRIIGISIVCGATAAGCGVEKLDGAGGGEQVPTEIQRIFDVSCATQPCHSAAARQGGLDLSTGAVSAVLGPSSSGLPFVEFGNVQGSEIAVQIMDGLMPQAPFTLDPVDQAILFGWIAGAELPSGTGGDDGMTGSDGSDGGSSTGDMMFECSIDNVVTADPGMVDAGMAAGQIPEDVGDVITRNCGCHFGTADTLIDTVAFDETPLAMLTDWQDNLATIQPKVEQEMGTTPMPPLFPCMPTGEMLVSIAPDDQQLLIDWLDAGAPDGATWTPPA